MFAGAVLIVSKRAQIQWLTHLIEKYCQFRYNGCLARL